MSDLTNDKPHLSKAKTEHCDTPRDARAINCTGISAVAQSLESGGAINCTARSHIVIPETTEDFVRESLSKNTRRAYASDLARFEAWGGTLPASSERVANYLSEHAASHAPSTLNRWLASLSKAHRTIQAPDSTKEELVKSVLLGIRRRYGRPRGRATPLTRELLFEVLEAIPDDSRGIRDRALLLVGFAGGFRRSELVGLEGRDIANEEEGVLLTIRRSKTDQTGQGRQVGIPFARGRHCPVKALRAWLDEAAIREGSVYRSVNRHGLVSRRRLSGQAVSIIIKERLIVAGMDASGFSGHSLRSGFVTSAAKAGVSSWKIRQQTGHASDTMLARYIRDSEIFVDNAAGALL